MSSLELKRAIAEAKQSLLETRWLPEGDLQAWADTLDGQNHERVMHALYALRKALPDSEDP